MPNFIRIQLTSGEVRHLDAGQSLSHGPTMARDALMRPNDGWLTTREETLVNRSQIVEAWLVTDADEPSKVGR